MLTSSCEVHIGVPMEKNRRQCRFLWLIDGVKLKSPALVFAFYVFMVISCDFVSVSGMPIFDETAPDADWFVNDQPIVTDSIPTTPDSFRNTSATPKGTEPGVPSNLAAIQWLQKFGYLGGSPITDTSESLLQGEAVTDAITELQSFAGLTVTGKLDEDTIKIMKSPRCGNADRVKYKRRHKRFVLGSDGWNKRHLTVFLGNWNARLGQSLTRDKLVHAFEVWRPYANLSFSFVNDPNADIVVAFGRGYHGDNYPFDGMGNVLAHAYYPFELGHYGGDIHFDDDENWRVPGSEGTGAVEGADGVQIWYNNQGPDVEFFEVAVHEIGHSLGLAHSNDKHSVMYPFYRSGADSTRLGYSDILGLYHLYIARRLEGDYGATSATPDSKDVDETSPSSSTSSYTSVFDTDLPTTPLTSTVARRHVTSGSPSGENSPSELPQETTTSPTTESDRQNSSSQGDHGPVYEGDFETVEEHLKHTRDAAKGNNGTTLDESDHHGHGSHDKEPPAGADGAPDICSSGVDAFANLRGELFAFKRDRLWRFNGPNHVLPAYPVKVGAMFQGLPDKFFAVDAVYEESATGNVILFSGADYWIHDGIHARGPYEISSLGLPGHLARVDAAFVWAKNGATYLFSGDVYWKLEGASRRVSKSYPKPISKWRGIPNDLDAAFVWQGRTYFVKGKKFWRFDDDVVHVEPQYPKAFGDAFLGCGAGNSVPSTPDLP